MKVTVCIVGQPHSTQFSLCCVFIIGEWMLKKTDHTNFYAIIFGIINTKKCQSKRPDLWSIWGPCVCLGVDGTWTQIYNHMGRIDNCEKNKPFSAQGSGLKTHCNRRLQLTAVEFLIGIEIVRGGMRKQCCKMGLRTKLTIHSHRADSLSEFET